MAIIKKPNAMDRATRLLANTRALTPKIVRVKPTSAEGISGDIAIGNTSSGMKLFVKLGNVWHTFSPDKEVPIEKYNVSNLTLDRTYNANASSPATTRINELADVLGTLIHDLHKFGLLKNIKT